MEHFDVEFEVSFKTKAKITANDADDAKSKAIEQGSRIIEEHQLSLFDFNKKKNEEIQLELKFA